MLVIVILITVPFPFHYLDAFKSIESFNEYLMSTHSVLGNRTLIMTAEV